MKRRTLSLVLLGALLLAACTGAQPAPAETKTSSQAETEPPRNADWTPRALSEQANFSDIIAAADANTPSKAEGCLLAGPGDQDDWYLGARFASPLRPLPKPSSDLFTQVLREGAMLRLLTQRGIVGSEGMTLVALTEVPSKPDEPALALIVTPGGVFVRRTDQRSGEGPVPLEQLPSRMASEELRKTPLYLTADAETPIQVVAHILQLANQRNLGRVGFALALPEATRLPEAPTAGRSPFACRGEPKIDEEGALEPERIAASVAPLSQAAQDCFDMLPYQDRPEGTTQLRVVVGSDGQVQGACLEGPGTAGSAALDRCLVEQARRLGFPKPSPPGAVVFVAPFRFTPSSLPQTRPLCPASRIEP